MLYLGVDTHKDYSYCTILDEAGQVVFRGKVRHYKDQYVELINSYDDDIIAVVEAGYNWGMIYDIFSELGVETLVGHPGHIKAIAYAKIKTDKRDSKTLAKLLKADLIPQIHVPPKEVRDIKHVIRERMFVVKDQTRYKNKIHDLLMRNHVYPRHIKKIFTVAGRKYIDSLKLNKDADFLLKFYLNNLDRKIEERKKFEKYIGNKLSDNKYVKLLLTIPGVGKVFAPAIALEINDISRFIDSSHFASYCGVVPSIHSSGKKTYYGNTRYSCNKYLKFALIEASWKSIVHSIYFKSYFMKRKRKKHPNKAIVAVARRLSEIIYRMLTEERAYIEKYTREN